MRASWVGSFSTPLKRPAGRTLGRGFSVLEILVVAGIVAVLVTLVLAGVSRSRASARSLDCLANLRQTALAFHAYCSDNAGRLPDPLGQQTTWEAVLRPYLTSPQSLRCPADEEAFPSLGSSYDWRDGGEPQTSVAGRPIYSCRADAVLVFDALPGWHQKESMNVVRIDGSALSMSAQQCLRDLRRSATVPELAR